MSDNVTRNVEDKAASNSTQTQIKKDEIKQNMIALEDYSDFHSSLEYSKSLNVSSDTWEALENADKLVQEARRKIVESSYDIPWLDLALNEAPLSELDESDLEIRQLVISKLQQGSKRKLLEEQVISENKKKDDLDEIRRDRNKICGKKTEKRKTYQSPIKVVETCRKCSAEKMENKLKEKYKLKAFNQVNDWKVKTSKETINNSKTNSKTQLSVRNVGKLDLIPISCNNSSKENVKTFVFNYESSEKTKNDENFIDVAIQTSFRELSEKVPALPEQEIDNLVAVCSPKVDQDIKNEVQHQTLQEKSKKLEDKKSNQVTIDDNTKTDKNYVVSNAHEESKGSFIKFLCQMTRDLEENVQMNLPNSDRLQENDDFDSWDDEYFDEFDTEEINLDAPCLTNLDKILCDFDKNIETMIKDTDKLEDLFSEARNYNKIDKTDNKLKNKIKQNDQILGLDERSIISHKKVDCIYKSPKKNISIRKNREINSSDMSEESDASDSIKIILKPRSRISSYESVSSEIFNQQARFSTPLNNYRNIKVSYNVDKKNTGVNFNDNEKFIITESKSNIDINSELKNDVKSDVNVFITRNQFSSPSSGGMSIKDIERKIIDDKNEKNCDSKLVCVEKSDEKSHFSQKSQTKLHSDHTEKSQTNPTKNSSQNCENNNNNHNNNNSIHNSISGALYNQNNNELEIVEKNHQELSEKSLIGDKLKKSQSINDDNEKQKNGGDIENDKNVKKNDLTPASSKDDIRDRTSFDISGIYSESFEESISEHKSTSKECSINKNENLQSEKKTRDEKEENKSIIHDGESEKKLSDDIKNEIVEFEDNKIIKLVSSQATDKNLTNESVHNSIKSDKLSKINNNYAIEKPLLSTAALNSLSQKSTINSSTNEQCTEINNKKESINSEDYSEGEIWLPSSSSYSFGEIRIPKSNLGKKYRDTNIPHRITIISHSSDHSIGEVIETDIESTSSFKSRGRVL